VVAGHGGAGGDRPPAAPAKLFAAFHEPLDFALRRALPPALAWVATFKELWDARQELPSRGERDGARSRRQRREDRENAA
jgi:hypothetical protein